MDDARYLVGEELARARQCGIALPGLLFLSERSARARALYRDLYGRPAAAADRRKGTLSDLSLEGESILPPVKGVRLDEAHPLLTRHAGPAGAAAAELMRHHLQPDGWLAGVLRDGVRVAAFQGGADVWSFTCRYDRIDPHVHELLRALKDTEVKDRVLELPGGHPVTVAGLSGREALCATNLAGVTVTRGIGRFRSGERAGVVGVDDNDLAALLARRYLGESKAIAAAVTALRALGEGRDRWLLQALWSSPPLRELAHQVERQLSGRRVDRIIQLRERLQAARAAEQFAECAALLREIEAAPGEPDESD